MHCAGESLQRPAADGGLRFWCDVSRVNRPERCLQAVPSGERLSTRPGVTHRAISSSSEDFTLGNQLYRKTRFGRRIDGCNSRLPSQRQKAEQAYDTYANNADGNALEHKKC